jgi:hypothetical protein
MPARRRSQMIMKKFTHNWFSAVIIIITMTANPSVVAASPPTIGIQPPAGIALPARFTLVYRVTRTDVRSQLMKWTDLWGGRQQHVPESICLQSLQTAPPATYTITVSCRDGAIYYRRVEQDGKTYETLYSPTSDRTFECHQVGIHQTKIFHHLQAGLMDSIPRPAASIGPIFFLRNPSSVTDVATPSGQLRRYVAQAYDLELGGALNFDATPRTDPCTVDVENDDGVSKVLNCALYSSGAITELWDYYFHEKALGVWLPRSMTCLTYEDVDPRATADKPPTDFSFKPGETIRREASYRYKYQLVSASPSAVGAKYFTPAGLIRDGAYINDVDDPAKPMTEFLYRGGGSSLDEQIKKAKWQINIAKSEARDGTLGLTNQTTPLMLIGSTLCAACAWLIWRRRAARS